MLKVKKILCPTDFSVPSYQAVVQALDLAAPEGVEITLLNIVAPGPSLAVDAPAIKPRKARFEEAQRNLDNMIRDLKHDHIAIRTLVRQGDVTSEILSAAKAEASDLIVMATRGASGWREFVLGSVADEVVRLACCPVLTIGDSTRRRAQGVGLPSLAASEISEKTQTPPTRSEAMQTASVQAGSSNGEASPYAEETSFPIDGSAAAKLHYLLHFAILAPSNRNSQPWLWKLNGEALELYADRSRALPHLDPEDRELIISCGASLEHLMVAMRHFGHSGEVQIFPYSDDPNLMARVSLGQACPVDESEDLLFEGIFRRHTNRKPFQERALPDSLINELRAEAVGDGTRLQVIHNAEKRIALIDLVVQGDHVQGHDALYLQETAAWIHPSDSGYADRLGENFLHGEAGHAPKTATGDGIPEHAFGRGGLLSRYNRDLGEAQADKDRLLAWCAPLLAVLTTEDDRPHDWLAAGRALARILLRASADGVQASFFNSPVEVQKMWPQLHAVLQCPGLPQMIMRLGYPTQETGATPRRALRKIEVPDA